MHTRRTVWVILWLVLAPFGLAACAGGGGSGSSGFEPVSEDAAIMQALTTKTCVPTDSLTVCPANVTAPALAPGRVETSLDEHTPVTCTVASTSNCNLVVPFMPEGFAPTAVFRVAVRNVGPNGKWHVGAAPIPNGTPAMPDYDGAVGLQAPHMQAAMETHVQVAILVFLHTPPEMFPPIDRLGETGAEFAYVSAALTLQLNM